MNNYNRILCWRKNSEILLSLCAFPEAKDRSKNMKTCGDIDINSKMCEVRGRPRSPVWQRSPPARRRRAAHNRVVDSVWSDPTIASTIDRMRIARSVSRDRSFPCVYVMSSSTGHDRSRLVGVLLVLRNLATRRRARQSTAAQALVVALKTTENKSKKSSPQGVRSEKRVWVEESWIRPLLSEVFLYSRNGPCSAVQRVSQVGSCLARASLSLPWESKSSKWLAWNRLCLDVTSNDLTLCVLCRWLTTTKTPGTWVRSTRRRRMSARAWLVPRPAVMSWNCRSVLFLLTSCFLVVPSVWNTQWAQHGQAFVLRKSFTFFKKPRVLSQIPIPFSPCVSCVDAPTVDFQDKLVVLTTWKLQRWMKLLIPQFSTDITCKKSRKFDFQETTYLAQWDEQKYF